MKIEPLIQRLENQIDHAFDTICSIQELENKKGPARHLSNVTKTKIGFINQGMLMRNLWDKMERGNLNKEQRLELVTEIGNCTYEHYKELYDFDSKKIAENS